MRWVSRDPIGYDGGVNLYEYVKGRPFIFTDPSGLQEIFLFGEQGVYVRPSIPLGDLLCGRSDNYIKPDPEAIGPHSTWRRLPSGEIDRYGEFQRPRDSRNPNKFERMKRYDGRGRSHTNKVTGKKVPCPSSRVQWFGI